MRSTVVGTNVQSLVCVPVYSFLLRRCLAPLGVSCLQQFTTWVELAENLDGDGFSS